MRPMSTFFDIQLSNSRVSAKIKKELKNLFFKVNFFESGTIFPNMKC